MATFLRRKLAGMMKKDNTPVSLTLARPEGPITFTKKEQQRYTWLLTMLDSDGDEQLGGAQGAQFLRRSHLSTDQLREVWRLASGGTSKAKLNKEDWLIACKLVAAVQYKGVEPSLGILAGVDALPIADFHYDNAADVDMEGLAALPASSVKTTVSNPTSYGSGLAKHTRYSVCTVTVLPHFARKEMTVWRRYSDFEWLHQRLCATFPAALIPLFPEKRLVGSTDEGFVAARQAALEAYVNKVAAHPALTQSVDLLVFLDATDAGLEAARSYIEAQERDEKESLLSRAGEAISAVASRGDESKLVIKADEAFISAVAQQGASLAGLNKVVNAGNALQAGNHRAADDAARSAKALLALADHERRHATTGASAAAAVASAAASSKRAQDALFVSGGAAGAGAGTAAGVGPAAARGGDAAAAAAFASHSAAANVDTSTISSMFAGDFNDPYSSLHAAAPGTSLAFGAAPAAGGGAAGARYAGGYAESLADLLASAGAACAEASDRAHASLHAQDAVWLRVLRAEREREAELGAAIARRDAALERVQEANAQLQRRKKALTGLKPGPDFSAKSAEAAAGVDKADKALAISRENLERMTEVLKAEIARSGKARRQTVVAHLAELARLQGAQARAEAEAWSALLPVITNSPAAADASREAVAVVARKAEGKARAAATAASAAAAAAAAPTFGGGADALPSAAPTFGADHGAMPASADEL